ncbi:MAG: DUF2089 domain-containing protein [Eubacteriales bacterium]
MVRTAPTTCPVCQGEYEITTLTCKKCGSELNGQFHGCDFCNLSEEDSFFVLTFLKCRGSIKDVEKELGISYPTVRGRLDRVISTLGLAATLSKDDIKLERKKIFERLENGEISAAEAAEQIKNL